MPNQLPNPERQSPIPIRAAAITNNAFVRVIHTGSHEQIVAMTVPPDGQTGEHAHPEGDQLYVVVDGTAEARVGDLVFAVLPGAIVFVEAGTPHNIVNRAVLPLRLATVDAPPTYPPGTVYLTRADAEAAEPAGL